MERAFGAVSLLYIPSRVSGYPPGRRGRRGESLELLEVGRGAPPNDSGERVAGCNVDFVSQIQVLKCSRGVEIWCSLAIGQRVCVGAVGVRIQSSILGGMLDGSAGGLRGGAGTGEFVSDAILFRTSYHEVQSTRE